MNLSIPFFMAGADTVFNHYDMMLSENFKNSNKYLNNKYMNGRPNVLLSYGIELIKKSLLTNGDKLHKKAKEKILNIYNTYHNNNRPFMIDSGGFSIFMGKVPINYIDNLIKYYLQFIKETCENPKYDDMVYQFMDVVPVNGITKQYSLNKMRDFYSGLINAIGDIPGALNKIYIIMQTSTMDAYDVFHHFIWHDEIYKKINSHKYAVGQLVPLNFNSADYFVRPYMIALLDVLELELENLRNGIDVYFHILGTSAITEIILITWFQIICEKYNLPLHITCDSTAVINNAAKSGTIHYINENPNNDDIHRITLFDAKYKSRNELIYNRNYTNGYYVNKVYEEMHQELEFIDPNDTWYNNERYSNIGAKAFCTYEAYSFVKIFEFIKKVSNKYKEDIIDNSKRWKLREFILTIIQEINSKTIKSNSRNVVTNNVITPLLNSLNYFELALNCKLSNDKRSFNLVKSMMNNNIHLSSNFKKMDISDLLEYHE